jgi:hypothetical protein
MLIMSTSGIHIVNSGKTGSAVVIDKNGIDIATGGNFKVTANS